MLYIFFEMSSRISEYSLNNQCVHFSPSQGRRKLFITGQAKINYL